MTGGKQKGSKGYSYKPTIVKNGKKSLVVPIILADDKIEAVRLANDSQYGLDNASICTEDLDNAEKLSRMIRSGIVTYSDLRAHFGVVKKSRFGRELSRYGMLEFVNFRSITFYDGLCTNIMWSSKTYVVNTMLMLYRKTRLWVEL